VPTTIDPALAAVMPLIMGRSVDVPLAIRRFTSEAGSDCALEAIQLTTAGVAAKYRNAYGDGQRISVRLLCQLMGVRLYGVPTRTQLLNTYGTSINRGVGGSHSGYLEFTSPEPTVTVPPGVDYLRARIGVGHELGHVLIHRRRSGYDEATIRLGSSPIEEALSEYAARLLLIPKIPFDSIRESPPKNVAEACLRVASAADVTVHSMISRLGDPDRRFVDIVGAILWRIGGNRKGDTGDELPAPYWHLCPGVFVPLKRGKARKNSLVARLFMSTERSAVDSARENVSIGTFTGEFLVDGIAWGSRASGSRLVLSVFRQPQ
jgi:hypothetical protein